MRRLERVKTWQLVVLFVLAAFVAATFLRLNSVGMLQRRDAVIAADKAGDDQDAQNRLYELQLYASKHMNASTGDVYLTGEYSRDSQALLDTASSDASSTSEADLFTQGDAACRGGKTYTPYEPYAICVANYIQAHEQGVGNGVTKIVYPNPDLYRHAYISPLWSPDFAGFSVLLVGIIVLLIVIRGVTWFILKMLLKRRYHRA